MPTPFVPDRRSLLGAMAALAATAAVPLPALAQSAFRPTRPVRLISPLLAGGATDAIIRPFALRLGELWGQSVVVENRPGGGTVIGTQAVVTAPPDGYTFGVAISALTVNPSLRTDLPYDTFADVTPIAHIGNVSGALVAHPSFPANDVKEFIALAKAKPGTISWASLGVGTGGHITGELLRKKAGIDVVHVPFNGSSAAYRDILPGRIPVGFVVLESALPHIRAGKLKLLALTDRRRNKLHPQFPTIAETVPGVGFESVFGLIGPRGLSHDLVKAINADVVKVLADPEVHKRLEEQSMEVVASSPAEFAAVIRREVEYWRQAVKESGAHVN
ncbi:MAG: tripartite tricarboxylate transporter substrate binding protein [Ramlibacter sp.]